MSARDAARGARAAFVFLTRIPVAGFPYHDAEWRWSAAHFPLVGLVVGGLAACVDRALQPLGELGAALGAIAASLLLTGGFHEDGLADTSDALGGGFDRDAVLRILKDSRVGAFGACAVVLSIAGRAALLARLGPQAAWALPLVGAAARVGPVWQIALLPYVATSASRSRGVAAAGPAQALVATGWALAIAAALVACSHLGGQVGGGACVGVARLVAVVAAMAAVTLFTGWRYVRRVGGMTGDFAGASEQLCELAGLAALAWGVS